jgi:Ca-activated chloride channel homolog
LLNESGVKLFIYGIGTEKGAPIPVHGLYKRDQNGALVISRMSPELLRNLASETGGIYVKSIAGAGDTAELYDGGIKTMLGEGRKNVAKQKKWREIYQMPLLVALILIVYAQFKSAPHREIRAKSHRHD